MIDRAGVRAGRRVQRHQMLREVPRRDDRTVGELEIRHRSHARRREDRVHPVVDQVVLHDPPPGDPADLREGAGDEQRGPVGGCLDRGDHPVERQVERGHDACLAVEGDEVLPGVRGRPGRVLHLLEPATGIHGSTDLRVGVHAVRRVVDADVRGGVGRVGGHHRRLGHRRLRRQRAPDGHRDPGHGACRRLLEQSHLFPPPGRQLRAPSLNCAPETGQPLYVVETSGSPYVGNAAAQRCSFAHLASAIARTFLSHPRLVMVITTYGVDGKLCRAASRMRDLRYPPIPGTTR